jgi:hypothetical protein
MGLNANRKILAAKIETTAGTAISVTGSDAAILVYDPIIQSEVVVNDRRPAGAAHGSLPGVPGAKPGSATFRVEVRGKGATGLPLWATALLPACGMKANASTYSPISAAADKKTITLAIYEDGLLKTLYGAMGSVKFTFPAGGIATAEFTFRGLFTANPSDTSLLTPTQDTSIPPTVGSGAFTLDGVTPRLSSAEIDLGNEVIDRPAPTSAGLLHAFIVNRAPKFTADPEAVVVATDPVFTELLAGTTNALSIVLNGGTNNTVTFGSPKVQYQKVTTGNRNGLLTHSIECGLAYDSGNDELTIAFS